MIENVLTIIVVILILNVLFFVHELGHVAVATLLGMKTEVIGLGLPIGKALKFQFKNIEYRIHGLLFGAYAIIPELSPFSNEGKPDSRSPLMFVKRILVVLGGPGAFLVAAWLVILFAFAIIGVPIKSICVEQLPEANPIARNAGVKLGDRITAIDGVPITSAEQLIAYLTAHRLTPVTISVLTENKSRDLPMVPNDKGKVGMALSTKIENYQRVSIIETVCRSVTYQFEILNMIWQALQQYVAIKMSSASTDVGGGSGVQTEVPVELAVQVESGTWW